MASAGRTVPEHEYLTILGLRVEELQVKTKRLNRRLRDARAAIKTIEDDLAGLADHVDRRLAELPGSRPR